MLEAQNYCAAQAEEFACDGLSVGHVGCKVRHGDEYLLIVSGNPTGCSVEQHFDSYKEAIRSITAWDGAFVALYFDATNHKLVIVSDFLGLKPLYRQGTAKSICFASETKAFSADPDLEGWGTYLALGYTLGSSTLAEGVERFPPATVTVIDTISLKAENSTYWRWPSPGSETQIDSVVDCLRANVDACLDIGAPGTVLLSGGFDSRLTAYMLAERGAKPDALIVSHRDENLDVDRRYAIRVARRLGLDYSLRAPDPDFFSTQEYIEYVWAVDAGHPSLYLFIAQILQYLEDGVVWDGLIPGYTLFPPVYVSDFTAFLAKEGTVEHGMWPAAKQLFTPSSYEALRAGLESSWKAETEKYQNDEHGIEQFLMRNRVRNRTGVNPFKAFTNRCDVYSLGASKDFFDVNVSVSLERRRKVDFYKDIFRKYYPDALRVPFVSGSTLFEPAPWSLSHAINSLSVAGANWLGKYPSLLRLFGAKQFAGGFPRSAFLDSVLGMVSEDTHIAPEAVDRIASGGTVSDDLRQLLFHWLTWKRIHQGRSPEQLFQELRSSNRIL